MKEDKFIVVVGTSAGGMKALIKLVEQLPTHFPAPLLIVQHLSSDATGDALLNALNKIGKLHCVHAQHAVQIKAGTIYLAPSNNHLMIEENGSILITKGAQENRSRPAIDPLFRSAAVSFGNRTIGILLTGYLNDGTSGLIAIQRCGGSCIIQDPADADYPDMPKNALNQMKPDYCIPIAEMGGILSALVTRKPKKQIAIPQDIIKEVKIAQRVLSDLPSVNSLGEQAPFNCPGCGGVLWKMNKGSDLRYRCHTGHAYTAAALLTEQTMKIEETMWTALRMFEERKNLLTTMAHDQKGAIAASANERAEMSQVQIDRIRAILLANDESSTTNPV
jgi:two-component system, chemotaxis family, protein-glutamate methylesterase/glutaminase